MDRRFSLIELNISSTITIGQSNQATWKWNGPSFGGKQQNFTLSLVNSRTTSTTVSSATPGEFTGTVKFEVSDPGNYQATLHMEKWLFLGPTAQFIAVPRSQAALTPVTSTTPSTSSRSTSISTSGQQTLPQTSVSPVPSTSATCVQSTSEISCGHSLSIPSRITTHSTSASLSFTSTPTSSSAANDGPSSVGLILASIFGALSGFLLLSMMAYYIWRRRRRLGRRNRSATNSSSLALFSTRQFPQSVDKEGSNWDSTSDSSLAPSDSVSRVMWSVEHLKGKVRPLAPSTTLSTVPEEERHNRSEIDEGSENATSSAAANSEEVEKSSPFQIPVITMTSATPSSSTVSGTRRSLREERSSGSGRIP
ncbi:hypothetical protein EV361DRAFT_927954 [Lentinula raphanica]|nr:hypothetical protein EV361DRAFT_927954 [Lentinula raphanica]